MRVFDYIIERKRQPISHINVANLVKNHGPFLDQLDYMKSLPVHSGCVNTIEWNKTGEYILSGSDDKHLCITKPTCLFDKSNNYTVLQKISTSHLGNIFGARFIPNSADRLIVSCSANGPVIVTDVNTMEGMQGIHTFNCHTQSIYDVLPIYDDDRVFLSCSEDSTVRLFDLRCHKSCSRSSTCPHPPLIRNSHPVTKISIHPSNSNMVLIGRADGKGLIYDRRKLPNPAKFSREQAHAERLADPVNASQKSFQFLHPMDGVVSKFCVPGINECRFTSLCFSPLGDQVLASFIKDDIYLFNYDKCARVELEQTLNRPSAGTPDEAAEEFATGNYEQQYQEALDKSCQIGHRRAPDIAETSSSSKEPHVIARHKHMQRNKERRMGVPRRLRLNGDWSDTGVDSTPNTDRMESLTNQALRLFVRQGENPLSSAFASFRFPPNANRTYNSTNNSNPSEMISSNRTDNDRSNRQDFNNESVDNTIDSDDPDDIESIDEHLEGGSDATMQSPTRQNHDELAISDGRIKLPKETRNLTNLGSSKRKERETPPSPPNQRPSSSRDVISTKSQESKSSRIRPETRLKFRRAAEVVKNKYKDIDTYQPTESYFGHRNRRTMIKEANFWGDNYIMSGSDCGRIFFWDKKTGKVVTTFKGDGYVVNRLAPNPNHYALASSGIDYDIKLWSTQYQLSEPLKPCDEDIMKIIENNENMLDETMSTLTVSPQLFFRFLATLTRSQSGD